MNTLQPYPENIYQETAGDSFMTDQSNLEENLDYLGRQLIFMSRDEQLDIQHALEKISGSSDANLAAAASFFNNLITAKSHNPDGIPKALKNLNAILNSGAIAEDQYGPVLIEYMRQFKRFRHNVNAYVLSLKNTLVYSASLIGLGLLLSAFYFLRVIPRFSSLFTSYDNELPTFTAFMANEGIYVVIATLSVALLLVFALGNTLKAALSSANAFKPMKPWTRRFFVAQHVTRAVNNYLYICFAYVMTKGTTNPESALDTAQRIAGADPRSAHSSNRFIAISKELGTLENELEYQLDIASENLAVELIRFRTGVNTAMQIAIFTVIGMLVIAVYQPIFSLGSIL